MIADVLCLLGADGAGSLLPRLAGALAGGGALPVKEIDVRPAWKDRLAQVQELVATEVARSTEGGAVELLPPPAIAATLEGAGLVVEHVPPRGRLHSHHLATGRMP